MSVVYMPCTGYRERRFKTNSFSQFHLNIFYFIMTFSDIELSSIRYSFLQMQYAGNKSPPSLSFANSSVVSA